MTTALTAFAPLHSPGLSRQIGIFAIRLLLPDWPAPIRLFTWETGRRIEGPESVSFQMFPVRVTRLNTTRPPVGSASEIAHRQVVRTHRGVGTVTVPRDDEADAQRRHAPQTTTMSGRA
jgi:hypothetical protein